MKTFTELSSVNETCAFESFCDLVKLLNCGEILEDDFWKQYQIHAGYDGELHVYQVGDHGEVLFDERGELYALFIDLVMIIRPGFKNSWPEKGASI